MKAIFFLFVAALTAHAIEKPAYETLSKEGNFEVRKYTAIPIVSAPMSDMGKRDESFKKLFRYISGDNADKKKIAMTSPVFMENADGTEKTGRMSFMIPANISEGGAPAPDEKNLAVSEMTGGTYAVLNFRGWEKVENRDQATLKLAELISKNGLKPLGKSFFALYDPPWTPEIFRRNEVWQQVEP